MSRPRPVTGSPSPSAGRLAAGGGGHAHHGRAPRRPVRLPAAVRAGRRRLHGRFSSRRVCSRCHVPHRGPAGPGRGQRLGRPAGSVDHPGRRPRCPAPTGSRPVRCHGGSGVAGRAADRRTPRRRRPLRSRLALGVPGHGAGGTRLARGRDRTVSHARHGRTTHGRAGRVADQRGLRCAGAAAHAGRGSRLALVDMGDSGRFRGRSRLLRPDSPAPAESPGTSVTVPRPEGACGGAAGVRVQLRGAVLHVSAVPASAVGPRVSRPHGRADVGSLRGSGRAGQP